MHLYFARVGTPAEIHRVRSEQPLDRGRRVLLRTRRGVELGQIVSSSTEPDSAVTAQLLRVTTDEDELLIDRLSRHKRRAVESCRAALEEIGSKAVLLDVDQLFDGGTLVLHFLGPVDDVAEAVTGRIVSEYESVVRTRHFAKLLREGCGPDCGTEQGAGCGGGCASCAVAGVCSTSS